MDLITGEVIDPFILDGTVENPLPDTDYSYQWTIDGAFASTDPEILVDQGGLYQVTITAEGLLATCTYIAETEFEAVQTPVIEANVIEASFSSEADYTIAVSYTHLTLPTKA